MKNLNEEEYLESLLKTMDNNTEKSDEESNEDLDSELGSVLKSGLGSEPNSGFDSELNSKINSQPNSEFNSELNSEINSQLNSESIKPMNNYNENTESDVLEELAVSEESDNSSMDVTNEIGEANTGVISNEKIASNDLGEEYNDIFEPEDSDFKISDIPDREAAELTQSEMDRLADMNSEELIDDVTNESISMDQLSEKKENNNLKENNISEFDLANKASDLVLDNDFSEAEAIAAAGRAITNGLTSAAGVIIPKEKLKKKKSVKKKSDKKISDKKESRKKRSILKFIKNIFFEDLVQTEHSEQTEQTDQTDQTDQTEQTEQTDQMKQESKDITEEPKDENQRVLEELYGNNSQEEFINDSDYKGDNDFKSNNEINDNIVTEKKGFFAKRKAKAVAKKAKLAEMAKAEDEAEELEYNKKKNAKNAKKLAAKNKSDEVKAKKVASKKPKVEKVKKPKKEKKPKTPTKPQDMLKIKPLSLVLLVSFVAGIVVLIEIGNTAFYYNNDISQAKLYYQNGNYQTAFDSLQGVDLKPVDEELYNQINTIMFVQKQYTSYQNYVKLGMGVEALDSLIKGIQRYYTYYPTAKELGVTEPLDANKALIINALKTTFSMSEEKAISYASLSDLDFTQYYLTLESYGGMVTK
ncbi:midas domain-containing protein [[Clostridium] fimetarium]|uniref:Uncharacterized protein n=1 Tax=[Clostridium] fimetarium TaxID=99656 RepID=A0A1I0PY07_9FIRM|nr:hypothetical protein [[Clostridium] fimetarium]SEW19359.1 hypothetical protein SAMN05421659_106116 [[Clostridium] fimetarium]